jgi:hypothetical protein
VSSKFSKVTAKVRRPTFFHTPILVLSPGPLLNRSVTVPSAWKAITTVAALSSGGGTYAVPLAGGAPQRICSGCPVIWAPDGKFLYAFIRQPSLTDPGKTRVFPLSTGAMLPKLPSYGMRGPNGVDDPRLYPGSYEINAYGISPGPDPAVYAYVKTTMHRNLFRIPVR